MTKEDTSRMNRAESGMSMIIKRRSEPRRERTDVVRRLCDCFAEAFAFVLLVLFFDAAFPLPFTTLPLIRLDGDKAPPFDARAVILAMFKGGGVAPRTGLLGHIKRDGSRSVDV